ncbi:MAG TPA: 5'-nucleotidase C-terminal domain-containing protein [Myxococcales bacterium]|nr:5'-nucleotidase C-terminal domain-containing protein [Myxococcales bacterium]
MPAMLLAALLLAAPKTMTLIHVNDTHSHVDAMGPKDASLDGTVGGLWKAASVIGPLRAAPGTALVHAGDLFHGDLFFQAYYGVAEMTILRELGLDAMALGNHEFEWGPGALYMAADATWGGYPSPLLSANLDFSGCAADPVSCSLQDYVHPSLIKDVGGVQVGFFALTTPYDPIAQPAPLVLQGIDDPAVLANIAWNTALALRAQGAQVVVLLSHLGLDLDRQLIIASGAPIDVIIGAHDHAVQPPVAIDRPGGGKTILAEAGDYYRYVGQIVLSVGDDGSVSLAGGGLIPIDASVPRAPDPVASMVQSFEAGIVAMYGDVFHTAIATAAADFPNHWDPAAKARDTAAGNLVTDIYRRHTGTDLAMEAMGLQEGTLVAGPIVGDDVFRLMPYGPPPLGYPLVKMHLTGAALLQGLELGVSLMLGTDAFMQVSGMRFEYDSCAPMFQRVRAGSVRIGGHRLDPAAVYSVTVNEFLKLVLPAFGVEILDAEVLPDLVYTVLRDEIARRGTIEPAVQNRIRDLGWKGCN